VKFDSIKKSACSVLFNVVSALAVPLVIAADSLAKGAGGKGPVTLVSDDRVDVLMSFVHACLDRAADLKSNDPEDNGATFDEKTNLAWRYVAELQERAIDAGLSVNLLEIFGRVEASTDLNNLRRMLKSEQAHYGEMVTSYGERVSEITTAEGSAHMGIIHRLSQATARLSVLRISVEEMIASAERLMPPVGITEDECAVLQASQGQVAILREVLSLLDTSETPQEEIRDRLQTFYEQHPERRGTLRFTEDPNVTKVAPVPLSDLGVPSAMIDPATVNVGAARAQLQVFEQSLRGIDADLVIVDEVKVAS